MATGAGETGRFKVMLSGWAGSIWKNVEEAGTRAVKEVKGRFARDDDEELAQENRNIKFDKLELKKLIGRGSYGTVYEGKWDDRKVAIKEVPLDESIEKEIDTWSDLKHPNIITLYGTSFKEPHFYIVMELAENGSLYNHIQEKKIQDMELSLRWAIDVAKGMSYLHGENIVHRDLKSQNVLLTTENVAKISDFSTARVMDHATIATVVGTAAWMAPEVAKNAKYSQESDLFAFGMVLWELMTYKVPFDDLKTIFAINYAIIKGERPPLDGVDHHTDKLIQSCWAEDPMERPSFHKVLEDLKTKGSG